MQARTSEKEARKQVVIYSQPWRGNSLCLLSSSFCLTLWQSSPGRRGRTRRCEQSSAQPHQHGYEQCRGEPSGFSRLCLQSIEPARDLYIREEAHKGIRQVAEQRSADATVRKRFHWQRRRCRANVLRHPWLERRAEPRANMAGKWAR